MRMQAEQELVPVRQIAVHPFDLVRIDIRARHLDRRRQVDDDLVLHRRLPDIHDGGAHLAGILQLRLGKAFRRIFHLHQSFRHLVGELAHQRRPVCRDFLDPFHALLKHHTPLQSGGGVIKMDNRLLGASDAVKGSLDQLVPRLGQHLDLHIIRNFVFFYQETDKIKIRLRSGREAHLDLLEAELHQMPEHTQLALMPHGFDQGLVPIAQIHAAPDRRLFNDLGRPLSVRQIDRRKSRVFFSGGKRHFLNPLVLVGLLLSGNFSLRFNAACIRSPGAAQTRATA